MTIEALLRRDRVLIGSALAVVAVVAWLYLVYLASTMAGMTDEDMSAMPGMARHAATNATARTVARNRQASMGRDSTRTSGRSPHRLAPPGPA